MKSAFLILLGIVPYVVRSQNVTHAKALITKLFETGGYDKRIRPTVDQRDAIGTVFINICFFLFHFLLIKMDGYSFLTHEKTPFFKNRAHIMCLAFSFSERNNQRK